MKRALLTAGCVALSASALAAQPGPAVPASGAPLQIGRMFFTPAERAQLDIARMQKKAPASPATAERAEPPPAPPQIVTYGGIVRRSDGKSMLWINNRLVEEREALAGLNLKGKVRSDGSVTLQVPDSGGSIDVKVGQSVEVHSGKVAEGRKTQPDAKPPADDARPGGADARAAAGGGKAPAAESADKKPDASTGQGPRMELGGRPPQPPEGERPGAGAR